MGLRLTNQELAELMARGAQVGPSVQLPRVEDVAQPHVEILGRGRRDPGQMNKLESKYAAHLEARKLAGEVAEWHYEAVKFKLADKTHYTPDFMVMLSDGTIEFHEAKGFWREDARIKIKVAARMYPFRFVAITKSKQGWSFEEFR